MKKRPRQQYRDPTPRPTTVLLVDAVVSTNRYNIFDEAIAEVLNIMEVNFKADFERSESYKNLNRAVQREAKELELLKQV